MELNSIKHSTKFAMEFNRAETIKAKLNTEKKLLKKNYVEAKKLTLQAKNVSDTWSHESYDYCY